MMSSPDGRTYRIAVGLSALLAVLLCCLSSCTPPETGFAQVRSQSQRRSGYGPSWTRGIAEDELVNRMVAELLSDELTLDKAVQIALVNNRRLQATFEELGVRRGALIQAGLPENPVFSGDWRFFSKGVAFEGVLTQNVISIITIPMRRELEGNRFEASKLNAIEQTIHLVADIKRAFFRYQASKQMVEMLQHVVQATKGSYMLMERLREAGNTRQLDVFRERALYEEAKVALNHAVATVAANREQLNSLMGLWGPQTQWETPTRLPEPPGHLGLRPHEDSQGVAAIDLGQFPPKGKMTTTAPTATATGQVQTLAQRLAGPPTYKQIAGARAGILGPGEVKQEDVPVEQLWRVTGPSSERFIQVERRAMEESLNLAIAWRLVQAQSGRLKLDTTLAIFPFLDAGGTAERNPEGKWGAGPAVSSPIPLFDCGQGQVTQESSRLRQRVEQYAALATEIRAIARSAEAGFQASRSRVLYVRDVIMPLHAALVAESQLQYNAMQITPFQLLSAKVQQIQAGQQYVLALAEYWLARTDLEQVLDGSLPPGVSSHLMAMPAAGMLPDAPGPGVGRQESRNP
ncbi:MAG: TolC family protein [Planctomycetaceae bacterium]|nr:TolC family protein [Planctomycetaceae bacterium]